MARLLCDSSSASFSSRSACDRFDEAPQTGPEACQGKSDFTAVREGQTADDGLPWPFDPPPASLRAARPPFLAPGRRRDCQFTDTPSPSVLTHLMKREGGAVEWQNSRRRASRAFSFFRTASAFFRAVFSVWEEDHSASLKAAWVDWWARLKMRYVKDALRFRSGRRRRGHASAVAGRMFARGTALGCGCGCV